MVSTEEDAAGILRVNAEIDQTLATFREKGIPTVPELIERFQGGYMYMMLDKGIPVSMVLGGAAAALACAVHRLAHNEIDKENTDVQG